VGAHVTRNKKYRPKTENKNNPLSLWSESKICEGSPNGARKIMMKERICETGDFEVWSKTPRDWE